MKAKFALPENVDEWLSGYVAALMNWQPASTNLTYVAGYSAGVEKYREDN